MFSGFAWRLPMPHLAISPWTKASSYYAVVEICSRPRLTVPFGHKPFILRDARGGSGLSAHLPFRTDQRGSFIATIVTPVPPEIQTSMDFKDEEFQLGIEPYTRRVTMLDVDARPCLERNPLGRAGPDHRGSRRRRERESLRSSEDDEAHGRAVSADISVSWARNRVRVPNNVPRTVSFPQSCSRSSRKPLANFAGWHLQDPRR